MKIMPYRTLDNRIDGVVITFTDVTIVRKVEIELREKLTELKKNIEITGGTGSGNKH